MSDKNKLMTEFINTKFEIEENVVLGIPSASIFGMEIIDYAISGLQKEINELRIMMQRFENGSLDKVVTSDKSNYDFMSRKLDEKEKHLRLLKLTRGYNTDY